MNTSKRTITPAFAAKLLENNKCNRPISTVQVRQLESILQRKRWKTTHQGILIGKNEALIDGQHRLLAIRNTGIEAVMLVSVDESLTSPLDLPLDQGRKRAHEYILGIEKEESKIARFVGRILLNRECTSDETGFYARKLNPAFEALHEYGLRGRTGRFGAAAILTAACIRILLDGDAVGYVQDTLKALTSNNPKALAPKPYSLYRQIIGMNGVMDSRQLFIRSLRAFDPAARSEQKIQVKDDGVAWLEATSTIKRALGIKAA